MGSYVGSNSHLGSRIRSHLIIYSYRTIWYTMSSNKMRNIPRYSNSSARAIPLCPAQCWQIRAYLRSGPSPTIASKTISNIDRSRGKMGRWVIGPLGDSDGIVGAICKELRVAGVWVVANTNAKQTTNQQEFQFGGKSSPDLCLILFCASIVRV